jgi:type III restriction enzyme
MAVLQAAADEWKNKWDHWYQYCYEQHYAYVNPILVIQVQNRTGSAISATDLDDCVAKVEERCGIKFVEGEVVHAFGDAASALQINGLNVPYVEPSAIADNRRIKLVFFKESLSTGWDCPRAETMMSFRHASDATYIAQLLGRMIRTPMQMHIQVDETLNDVHLYLPYFDADTVNDVVKELQNSEGGELPTEIFGESLEERVMETLSVKPRAKEVAIHGTQNIPGQLSIFTNGLYHEQEIREDADSPLAEIKREQQGNVKQTALEINRKSANPVNMDNQHSEQAVSVRQEVQKNIENECNTERTVEMEDTFDREAVMKAINDYGLLSYDVRTVRINNYLNSLYSLARLLTQSGMYENATDDVLEEIVKMICEYVAGLKRDGKYDEMAHHVMEFEMKSQVFNVFGEEMQDDNIVYQFMSTTDTDIDRQFRRAENKLGNEGVGNKYGRCFYDSEEPNAYKIDVILYAADDECIANLMAFAERTFHKINDDYRRKIVGLEERFIKQYNTIVSDGDIVSKHNFRLPETITQPKEQNGREYTDHLFVDEFGVARINLNDWEEGVLEEERKQPDFVCWLRNPPRKPWSLCIPYEMGGVQKPTYPDFVVVRDDLNEKYILDILEPHDPTRIDNLGKAKGFAEYARQNPGVGRIQLIRMGRDGANNNRFKRLDMAKSAVRDKVSRAMTNDELDHIFETDGFFM